MDLGVGALCYLSPVLATLGYLDQALTKAREALALAQELSHPFSQAFAVFWVGDIHSVRGESQAALEGSEALVALSNEHGFPYWAGVGAFMRARSLADRGQLQEGIAGMRAVLEAMRSAAAVMGWHAHGRAGQVEEGLRLIAEAWECVARTGECLHEPSLHRLEGELLLALSEDNQARAEGSFRNALEIARRRSAKLSELAVTLSLSRLRQKQGRKEEARRMLAAIYGWFTEGFDTKPLEEARALLKELS
jgi:predicted ATPase